MHRKKTKSRARTQLSATSDLISVHEAAKIYNVAEKTIYRWVKDKRIPHRRIGKRTIRFSIKDLKGEGFKPHVVELTSENIQQSQKQKRKGDFLGNLNAFLTGSKQLVSTIDESSFANDTIQMLKGIFRFDYSGFLTLDENERTINLCNFSGISPKACQLVNKLLNKKQFTEVVFNETYTRRFTTISSLPLPNRRWMSSIFNLLRIKSGMVASIYLRGKLAGAITIASKKKDHYSTGDLETFSQVSTFIGILYENMTLHRDIALELSINKTILNSIPSAVGLIDKNFKIIRLNKASEKLSGILKKESLIGKNFYDFSSRALRKGKDDSVKNLRRIIKSKKTLTERYTPYINGKKTPLLVKFMPITLKKFGQTFLLILASKDK